VHEAAGALRVGPTSDGPAAPVGGLRRLSVYADCAHVELVLAATVPIGSLIPPIVDILTAQRGHRGEPVAIRHQLSTAGGTALDPSKTLAQLGIQDGTTLILTSTSAELAAPRFDDAAETISASLSLVRPWNHQTARLVGALTAGWLASVGAVMLIRTAFDTNDARRSGCLGVAAAVGLIALFAAPLAYRVFHDMAIGLTLGLVATGFAALAGLLAVPGGPGAPNALLAAAAAAASAAALRVMGCPAAVFTALCCLAATAAAAAVVAMVSTVPLPAIGAACAAVSLFLVEASAPVSIVLAGLSPRLHAEPDASVGELAPHRLNTKVIRAKSWLTSLVVAFAASAALGAVAATAGPGSASAPRSLGIVFATLTGGALLLRARSYRDPARSMALIASGIAALSAALVAATVAYPRHAVYIAATSTMLAAAALWLGFINHAMELSPVARRSVEMLEYLALAVIAPLACWICGLYSAARGLNLR
jgi:type VII secretion integral membrane protein EccD